MRTMKSIISLFVLFISVLSFISCSSEPELSKEEVKKKATATFQKMQENLFQELSAAMKKGGPVNAIGTCKTVSPEMENSLSTDNLKISRISDKPRNPDHIADQQALEVLNEWKQKLANQEKIEAKVIETDDEIRVLSPIRIANENCLKCHGSNIAPEVRNALSQAYPNDQATGYESIGELRGAFQAIYQK